MLTSTRIQTALTMMLLAAALAACEGSAGKDGEPGKQGDPGSDGVAASCTVEDNGDGTQTITCSDGTTADVQSGKDGAQGKDGDNGASCTVKDNGDGTSTVTCEDGTVATIADGSNGSDGDPGAPGDPGGDGADGSSCTVKDNGNGTKTITCTDGTVAIVADGGDGESGGNVEVTSLHGSSYLMSSGEYANGAKTMVNATITSATADAAGVLTVNFSVVDADNKPVTGLASISANVAKLVLPAGGVSYSKWVPYLYRTATAGTGEWNNPPYSTPAANVAYQPTTENNGVLTNHGDGTYTYVFAKNLTTATVNGAPITYERNLTHRVSIMMGGHSGPTDDAVFDFVPDGSGAVTEREIVTTAACKSCHGEEFHGHGGNRVSVENCATCHVPGNVDPQSGENLDLKVMIHKIHAGGELERIPGPDGIVWDNPATVTNEAADNGQYAIWGNRNTKHEWWKVEFPAIIDNCQKCHDGSGAQSDNWKTVPSREACNSCHESVDFVTGANHPVGAQATDNNCSGCHQASGNPLWGIPEVHDWMGLWAKKDPRNVPEFVTTLSVSTPANGQYFVAGEAPVVTVKLATNEATPVALDHTTLLEDTSAEGCLDSGCPSGDGRLASAGFFVHGPRGNNMPVLTTAARAQIASSSAGPFDISAAGATLDLKVDGGEDLISYNSSGGDFVMAGNISVPVSSGAFSSTAAATPAEMVTWLNANTAFKARAVAFVDGAGKLVLRSRNLGQKTHAIQLKTSAITTAVFAGDVTARQPSGSTPSNNLTQRTNPANNDPKISWFTDRIEYQLDPVDDLAPGTYVINTEISDRGRKSATDYKTPSVAKLAFQVKTATEEELVANNCNTCHQSNDGKGFILDFARHYKIFDNGATDQCNACHDKQPQLATGATWSGARPIGKRVHAIHNGANLSTPLLTVDYSNGDPVAGRNWDITLPQDVRNCETCHTDGASSGTWATKAARLPCSGCHDSQAAVAHMKLQTYDPTPADAWSGDEQESCTTCH